MMAFAATAHTLLGARFACRLTSPEPAAQAFINKCHLTESHIPSSNVRHVSEICTLTTVFTWPKMCHSANFLNQRASLLNSDSWYLIKLGFHSPPDIHCLQYIHHVLHMMWYALDHVPFISFSILYHWFYLSSVWFSSWTKPSVFTFTKASLVCRHWQWYSRLLESVPALARCFLLSSSPFYDHPLQLSL